MSGRRAGCPGLQEEPDVRAGVEAFCALWIGGAGCPGEEAGFPGLREEPDVRARGPDVRADGESFCRFWCVAPDFRASGRMSGLGPDVRGL